MIGNLRLTTDRNTEQDWLKTNLARFTAMLQGQRDLSTVGRMLLSDLAPLVEAQHGVLYQVETYNDGQQSLRLLAAYDGQGASGRIDEMLDVVELRDRAGDKVGGYSHGMRQRLGIAAALLRNPRLLLLDEPTTGLDPAGMRDMRALVRRLAAEGITVLLSSHLLGEVEELCNRVAIVRTGRIVYEGTLRDLLATAQTEYRLRATEPERALMICSAQLGAEKIRVEGPELRFQADEQAAAAVSIALGQNRIGITALVPERASLEELFLGLTGGESGDKSASREEVA
jgi:ABC-2 type transport system ATP-binding protein